MFFFFNFLSSQWEIDRKWKDKRSGLLIIFRWDIVRSSRDIFVFFSILLYNKVPKLLISQVKKMFFHKDQIGPYFLSEWLKYSLFFFHLEVGIELNSYSAAQNTKEDASNKLHKQ